MRNGIQSNHRVRINKEDEEAALSLLPTSIRNFILHDAVCSYSAYAMLDRLKRGMSEAELLRLLQRDTRKRTRKTYGPTHPQA